MQLLPPPVALARGAALFIDFDGTLVDLAPTPDAVRPAAHLPALLARLAGRLGGRLALVSGRGAGEVAAFLGDPPLIVAGSHGMETRWPDGRIDAPAAPDTQALLAALHGFVADHPGTLAEEKRFGAALHWRRAPEAEAAATAFTALLAERHGLHVQPGKMVAELRAAGGDKGDAVTTLMRQPGWAGARPLFLGDDLTDEAGFRAATALGGAGILVGEQRATAAGYRLADVADTLAWLAEAEAHTAES